MEIDARELMHAEADFRSGNIAGGAGSLGVALASIDRQLQRASSVMERIESHGGDPTLIFPAPTEYRDAFLGRGGPNEALANVAKGLLKTFGRYVNGLEDRLKAIEKDIADTKRAHSNDMQSLANQLDKRLDHNAIKGEVLKALTKQNNKILSR